MVIYYIFYSFDWKTCCNSNPLTVGGNNILVNQSSHRYIIKSFTNLSHFEIPNVVNFSWGHSVQIQHLKSFPVAFNALFHWISRTSYLLFSKSETMSTFKIKKNLNIRYQLTWSTDILNIVIPGTINNAMFIYKVGYS